jgi:hypothetical protein
MHYLVGETRYRVGRIKRAIDQAREQGLAVWCMSDHAPETERLLAWPWREQDLTTDEQKAARAEYDAQQERLAPFYWKPENGEPLAAMGERLGKVVESLQNGAPPQQAPICPSCNQPVENWQRRVGLPRGGYMHYGPCPEAEGGAE